MLEICLFRPHKVVWKVRFGRFRLTSLVPNLTIGTVVVTEYQNFLSMTSCNIRTIQLGTSFTTPYALVRIPQSGA